jgi:hypothetical protein
VLARVVRHPPDAKRELGAGAEQRPANRVAIPAMQQRRDLAPQVLHGHRVTLTNTDTGQSVAYNISGPVRITSQDGLETDVFLGRSLLFSPDIGMLVTSGRAVTTFDPDTGEFTLVSHRGHAEDVCATLAP